MLIRASISDHLECERVNVDKFSSLIEDNDGKETFFFCILSNWGLWVVS